MNDKIKTHKNLNGESYYSKEDENGEIIYSFTKNFVDIWSQEDEDYHNSRYKD